jgi:hypothetical protein
VIPDPDGTQPTNRGPNFAKNRRPGTSKRVTFALGQDAQDQADRLARVLSTYRKGGVSQSALIRGLLQFAETVALQSGDAAVRPVFEHATGAERPVLKVTKPDPEAVRIWDRIRAGFSGT